MDNSKSKKEGVSRTYKGFDGYAPMMAYIGTEWYAINFELREGKQYCQKGTVEFLQETINLCHKLTNKPLLIRLDSGNDSIDNVAVLMDAGFIQILSYKFPCSFPLLLFFGYFPDFRKQSHLLPFSQLQAETLLL